MQNAGSRELLHHIKRRRQLPVSLPINLTARGRGDRYSDFPAVTAPRPNKDWRVLSDLSV